MKLYRILPGLLILCCMILSGPTLAGTGTVDDEVIAATKAGPEAAKKLESSAIKTIKSDAPRMEKDHACRILRIIGTVDSIEALGELLVDEDNSHVARYALESMKYPEVDKALRNALGRTSGQVKVGIINSLAIRGGTQNVDVLIPLLKDTDSQIADAAAGALGRTGSPDAVKALLDRHKNGNDKIRAAAADGLLTAANQFVTWRRFDEALTIYRRLNRSEESEHVRMGAFAGIIEAQPDKKADLLMEAVKSEDWKIRGMAIDLIVALKGNGITERFSAVIDKLDSEGQVLMLDALVARNEKAALRPVVTKAVSSTNRELRELAVKSLGDIGDADSVDVLANVISNSSVEEDRSLSASSLRRLPGRNINNRMIKVMKASNDETKSQLIQILHDRDASEAVDEFLVAASDNNPVISKAALKALADLAGPEDQKALVHLLVNIKGDTGRSEAERAVIAVSRKLDDAAATEPIMAAMSSSTASKCSLLRVLGGIGSEKAYRVVRLSLDDGNAEVRDTAVRTLADWPDATASRTLLKIFQTTSNKIHRVLALRGCVRQLSTGSVTSDKMLSICTELLKGAKRPDEKKQVLACLAKSDSPFATEIVEPLLSDSSVQAEAELAMLSIIRNMMGTSPARTKAEALSLRSKSGNQSIKTQTSAVIKLVDKFNDYVMAWQVCGPYSRPFTNTFDEPYGPEEGGIEPVEWKPLPISETGNRPWMFDLGAALGGRRKAGYVRTWVHSDAELPARIEYGTDDGNKLWLNGELVHADRAGGAASPGEHKIPVTLKKGWNELMLKVTQDTGTWQFCLAVRNETGGKLDNLRIQAREPIQ